MTLSIAITANVHRGQPFEATVTDSDGGASVATACILRVTNVDGVSPEDQPFTTDASGTTVISVPPTGGPRGANTFEVFLAPDTTVQASTTASVLNT